MGDWRWSRRALEWRSCLRIQCAVSGERGLTMTASFACSDVRGQRERLTEGERVSQSSSSVYSSQLGSRKLAVHGCMHSIMHVQTKRKNQSTVCSQMGRTMMMMMMMVFVFYPPSSSLCMVLDQGERDVCNLYPPSSSCCLVKFSC